MPSPDEQNAPVKAKTVLIDPASMTVLWMNEAASHDFSREGAEDAIGMPVERAVPIVEILGVPEALASVARDGAPRHLRADLMSGARGSVSIVASVYRLPDGTLLLVMENAFHVAERTADKTRARGSRRRGR